MNQQELQGLQEAYMEVVMNELDEGYKELPVDKMVAKSKSLSRKPKPPGSPRWGKDDERASNIRKTAGTHSRAKVKKVEKANRERGTQREEYDLYDIILSHLLDEGYAETPEAAEVIMVNMSEDWRESIVEEMTTTHPFKIGTNRPPSAPVLPPPTGGSRRPKPTSSIPKLPRKGTPIGVGWGP